MDPQNFETRRDLVSVCPVCGFGDCRSPESVDVTPPHSGAHLKLVAKWAQSPGHQTA